MTGLLLLWGDSSPPPRESWRRLRRGRSGPGGTPPPGVRSRTHDGLDQPPPSGSRPPEACLVHPATEQTFAEPLGCVSRGEIQEAPEGSGVFPVGQAWQCQWDGVRGGHPRTR